jgi:hypothetical protein
MITTLEIERRFAELRAGQFREEASGHPPGSPSGRTRFAKCIGTRNAPTG